MTTLAATDLPRLPTLPTLGGSPGPPPSMPTREGLDIDELLGPRRRRQVTTNRRTRERLDPEDPATYEKLKPTIRRIAEELARKLH